jgi:hypothetical protein
MNPRCQVCTGRQRVYCCRTHGLKRTRFLRCVDCGSTSKTRITIDAHGFEIPETGILTHSTNIIAGDSISDKIQSVTR